jgi:hypothetical protein
VSGPAYEVLALSESPASQALWFNLLNEGYAVPVIGSGGGCLEGGRVPAGQTLVQVAGALTREAVIAACRRGRSSVSFGPAVFARIAERDRGPGDRVPADGHDCSLQVRAFAARFATLEQIEILRNGEVLHTEKCGNAVRRIDDFSYAITERNDAWYVVRVTERYGRERTPRVAWTNPIYFDTPSRRPPVPARTRLRGTLRAAGGTPLAGTLSLLEPGAEKRTLAIGTDGDYDVSLLSSGTAVFSSPGYDPVARQPFAHPQVQKALAALHCERQGRVTEALARRSIYGSWRVLLAELEWDVELAPVSKGTR